jgi:hypothetical protein
LDTLEAYDGSPDFLRTLDLDKDGLTKAIIGTMGDIDAYQLPDSKGYSAFSRWAYMHGAVEHMSCKSYVHTITVMTQSLTAGSMGQFAVKIAGILYCNEKLGHKLGAIRAGLADT